MTDATAAEVAAERAKVATEGWGARLLAQQRPDGTWDGGAYRPDWVPLDEEHKGFPSRWITLRALRVLRWWDARPSDPQTASSSHDTVPEPSVSTP